MPATKKGRKRLAVGLAILLALATGVAAGVFLPALFVDEGELLDTDNVERHREAFKAPLAQPWRP